MRLPLTHCKFQCTSPLRAPTAAATLNELRTSCHAALHPNTALGDTVTLFSSVTAILNASECNIKR